MQPWRDTVYRTSELNCHANPSPAPPTCRVSSPQFCLLRMLFSTTSPTASASAAAVSRERWSLMELGGRKGKGEMGGKGGEGGGEGEGKERLAMVSSGMAVRHCWGRMSRHPLDIVRSGRDVVLLYKEGDKGVVFEEEVGTVLQSEGPLLRGEEFASDVKGALHGREEGGVVGHCKEYSTLSEDPTSGWQACSA